MTKIHWNEKIEILKLFPESNLYYGHVVDIIHLGGEALDLGVFQKKYLNAPPLPRRR